MAEQQKKSIAEMLGYAEQIAAGVDAKGNPPGADDFDAKTAPDGAMRWCASILKIVIARVAEHQEWARKAIHALRAEVFGRPATEDAPAVPGIAALRNALSEALPLLHEIVACLPAAPPGVAASAESRAPSRAPTDNGSNPSGEGGNGASEAPAPSMADEMAAKLAAAISTPVVPIKPV